MAMRIAKVAIAIGLMMALSAPVLGMSVAARGPDPMVVELQKPLAGRETWYGGAVIPVKIFVNDPDDEGPVLGANATLWVDDNPASGPGNSMMGNTFIELGEGYYQYNLETKPYPAGPGSPPIKITIQVLAHEDRAVTLDVMISLR